MQGLKLSCFTRSTSVDPNSVVPATNLVRILALTTLFVSAAVWAIPSCTLTGDGNVTPYQVASYADLEQVGTVCSLSASYVQTADIDASGSVGENSGAGFSPIGNKATPFTGTFDGAGHTITDLHIADAADDDVGLFGYIHAGTVDSLVLVGAGISGTLANDSAFIGAIAGFNWQGTIRDCRVTDSVSGLQDSAVVGGLVGYSNGTIQDCHSASVDAGGSFASVGGIVGQNEGIVRGCRASGSVTGLDGSNIGGVVGYSDKTLATDTSTATVTETGDRANAGGIVGWSDAGGSVDTVYSSGTVSGNGFAAELGGIAGRQDDSLVQARSDAAVSGSGDSSCVGGVAGYVDILGAITASYATGNVTGTGDVSSEGGLAGYSNDLDASIVGSWATGNVSGNTSSNVGGVVGLNDFGGTLLTSYATGTVVGNSNSNVGGAMGQNNGFASHVYATGRVQGFGDGTGVGGLVGLNNYDTIVESYATGSVNATTTSGTDNMFVGGICGYNDAKLRQVYAVGQVLVTGPVAAVFFGGVAGYSSDSVVDAYWNTQTTGMNSSQGLGYGSTASSGDSATPLTTAQMQDSINFTDFVFGSDTTWKIAEHKSYPALNGLSNAPFAFADSLLVDSTGLTLARLLTNDADADTASPSLVAVVDSVFTGTLGSFAASGHGTLDTLLYRVGDVVSAGDTLWGGEATAALELVYFQFALGMDSLHTYGDAPFTASATVDPSFPVTFASQDNTVAGVSGTQVQPLKTGATSLSATIGGDLVETSAMRIAPKTLTITGAAAQDKVYDRTTAATVTGQSLLGKVGSDDVGLSPGTATFATPDVGNAKPVTVAGSTLTGSTAGDYTLAAWPSLSANITAKTLMIAAKNDTIPLNGTATLTYTDTGLVSGDAITGALASSNSGTATSGMYDINQGTLSADSNYSIVFSGAKLDIRISTALASLPKFDGAPTISHELATNIGQAFAPPAIGSGRAELGTGVVAGGQNTQTVDLLLTGPGSVSVAIYDNLGSLVISFSRDIAQMDLNDLQATKDGRWILPLSWNLRASNGIAVPTGVYLWKIDIQTLDGKKLDVVKKLGVRETR